MKYRFNAEKAEELIKKSGIMKSSIAKDLDTSITTFGRWMREETTIPLVKAAELVSILSTRVSCKIEDLLELVEENE